MYVTGAAGWLGRRLVEVLADGMPDVPALAGYSGTAEIRGLAQRGATEPARALSPDVQWSSGDVTDPASLAEFLSGGEGALLVHCAGLIHPARFVRDLWRVNAQGTRNVIDAAVRAGVKRMVHVSSNSPVGCNPGPAHVFDEASPYHPYLAYGRSKRAAEEAVRAAEKAESIETAIIRPPWFYGPFQPARQTLFFRMIREGRFPIVGDGENRRSMAYVDNICQGALLCALKPAARGQTYWIADRRPYSMNEIIATVEAVLKEDFGLTISGRRMRLPRVAGDLAYVADALLQGVGLYAQKVHVLSEMHRTIACSIGRAERELGYDPKIELREGMRRSVDWVLSSGARI